jgi:hypothetical protein
MPRKCLDVSLRLFRLRSPRPLLGHGNGRVVIKRRTNDKGSEERHCMQSEQERANPPPKERETFPSQGSGYQPELPLEPVKHEGAA